MINRVHAPTKVNNCVKYEQNLLYIVGCRVVTRVRRMDRLKDGQLRQGRTIPYIPKWSEGKNDIIGIIYIFITITISCIFNWKQIQLASLKYQLSPWLIICTSFNGLSRHIIKMAINHIEIILCASKLHVFKLVLIFCPNSTDVAKYNNVMMIIW